MRAAASRRGLHNVPAELTSFVGRRRELDEIRRRLGDSRLITLTGAGGVGKTRLALRAAKELARAFPDGVWLVELAKIEDPPLVTQAVFDAFGVQDHSAGWSLSRLVDYLAPKHALLILDNCEHVLDSCAVLANFLLKACPDLHILATSRQPFSMAGEARLRVSPLGFPGNDEPADPHALLGFDAVALLHDRIRLVQPDFQVDKGNAKEMVRLCRRLDGIPIALELAAVQMEALGLKQLNDALAEERTDLRGNRGGDARQQTLEATISWSYRLLSDSERRLWDRLSVFAGGFTEGSAIEVCSEPELSGERIVEVLASLVEKSIVTRVPGLEPSRYGLLETLRQYGRQRLCERGAAELEVARRHRDWILRLAMEVGAWDGRQIEAFNRIHVERHNLWAALDFCVRQQDEAELGVEIARQVYPYWVARGPLNDARRLIGSLLERVAPDSGPRARALFLASTMAWAQGDYSDARWAAEESVRIGRLMGDDELVSPALVTLSILTYLDQRTTEAADLLTTAVELANRSNDWQTGLRGRCLLLSLLLASGDAGRAAAVGEEVVAMSRESGEVWVRGMALQLLADALWRLGKCERAIATLKEAIGYKHALDDRFGLAPLLESMAWMAAERSHAQTAATLLGSAEAVRALVMAPIHGHVVPQHRHTKELAQQQLGDTGFSAAFEVGRQMGIDEAVAYALDEKNPASRPPVHRMASRSPVDLTRREAEIARWVAQGLSNRQIAGKLVLSERTVESHVWNILNKLGFNTRTQIASWAVQQVLPAAAKPS